MPGTLHTLALLLTLGSVTLAQPRQASQSSQSSQSQKPRASTTTATPTAPTVQPGATRPSGTEQQLKTSPSLSPSGSQDPTAPPGVRRPAPSSSLPSLPTSSATPPQPTPDTSAAQPLSTVTTPGVENSTGGLEQKTDKPALSVLQQSRSVPPLPSMARVGVTNGATLPLSLNDAVRRALENNNDIEVARVDVGIAETLLRSLEAVYDPVFQITPQLNNRVTPVASALGGSNTAGTVTTTSLELIPSVTKLFGTGGGQYQFSFSNAREATSSTFSQLTPFYSANLGVTFTQPLMRNRSIDLYRRDIRVQRKRLAQSDADFRRLTINIIAQVQTAYWDLVLALRDQQNRVANLNLARVLFRQTEQRIAAGSVAPLERAEVQTELSSRESELLSASQNVSIAENTLKQLMLRDQLAPEWSAAILPLDQPAFDEAPVNLTDALAEARRNRPELSRLRLQREISDIDIQYYRNQKRPRVDIVTTVAATGLAGTPVIPTGTLTGDATPLPPETPNGQVPLVLGNPAINANAYLLSQINQLRIAQGLAPAEVPLVTPQTRSVPPMLVGGYARTLRNLLGLNTRNIVVGVAIEVPFRNRRAKANLAGVLLQQEQLAASVRDAEQTLEAEVRNAAQYVETARQRVLAARDARHNAELQLEGEQRLYQVGRSSTFLLFQRENQLTNARSLSLRAETDYNKALAAIQQATSATLRAFNVVVEIPR